MKYLLYFTDFFDATVFAFLESVFQNLVVTSQNIFESDFLKLKLALLIIFVPKNSDEFVQKLTQTLVERAHCYKMLLISKTFSESLSTYCMYHNLAYYSLDKPITDLSKILVGVSASLTTSDLRFRELKLLEEQRQVFVRGILIKLSNMEFSLLKYLLINSGRAISKLELLENVWGHRATISTRTVDVHIARLRKKIDLKFDTNYIQTVHCYGYLIA